MVTSYKRGIAQCGRVGWTGQETTCVGQTGQKTTCVGYTVQKTWIGQDKKTRCGSERTKDNVWVRQDKRQHEWVGQDKKTRCGSDWTKDNV